VSKDLSEITGLPDDLGIGEDLARAGMELTVRVERRRYGKPVTLVEGFDRSVDLDEVASELKRKMATGGTVDEDARRVELQGDHAARLPEILREKGYAVA
jgi:translation initiation factor 1